MVCLKSDILQTYSETVPAVSSWYSNWILFVNTAMCVKQVGTICRFIVSVTLCSVVMCLGGNWAAGDVSLLTAFKRT